jgi:hypothetical protein
MITLNNTIVRLIMWTEKRRLVMLTEKRHELENILAFRNAKRHALRIAKQYTHYNRSQ